MNCPADAIGHFRCILVGAVINPILYGLSAIALLLFAWGVVEFMFDNVKGGHDRERGKNHMLWGIIGFVIMTGATAIINILVGLFGQGPVV